MCIKVPSHNFYHSMWKAKGAVPSYSFLLRYKIKLDDLFFHYLLSDHLTLEIYINTPEKCNLFAHCNIKLQPLLGSWPRIKEERLPLMSIDRSEVRGY